ncbi:MAG: VOC family protein [Methyloligellaceae bacterium]
MSSTPEGFHTITPYVAVASGAEAIETYKAALGAQELMRMPAPDSDKIMHACLQIGTSKLFLCDEYPEKGMMAPKNGAGGAHFYIYVDDVDAQHQVALAAGMTETMAPDDMFWGDRMSELVCPFGHHWTLATHVRDVSPEEMAEAMSQMAG